jgi:hypothetical protein
MGVKDRILGMAIPTNWDFMVEVQDGFLPFHSLRTSLTPFPDDFGANVAAAGNSGYRIPRDANNNKVIYCEYSNTVFQVIPVTNQGDCRMYYRIPQGVPRGGLLNLVGNPDLTTGVFGWMFESHESTNDNPSKAGEFMLLPFIDFEYGYFNNSGNIRRLLTTFWINQIQVAPYDVTRADHQKKIIQMLTGNRPADLYAPVTEPYTYTKYKDIYNVPCVKWDGTTLSYVDRKNGQTVTITP